MKKSLIFLSLSFFLFACEMHKQENFVQGEVEAKVVNLSVIEELTSAIVQNDVEFVKKTLAGRNFEINVPNKEGELILNKAMTSNRLIIGYYLLKAGADPTAQDQEGFSAQSLSENHPQEASWLALFNGDNLEEEVANEGVFMAISDAKPENELKFIPLVEGYFFLGANPDGRNAGQFTYLMEAAGSGLLETVKFLCTFPETDPNVKVERGRGRRARTFTALILAKNYPDIQEALRECGAVE